MSQPTLHKKTQLFLGSYPLCDYADAKISCQLDETGHDLLRPFMGNIARQLVGYVLGIRASRSITPRSYQSYLFQFIL